MRDRGDNPDHDTCLIFVRNSFRALGVEVDVFDDMPVGPDGFWPEVIVCPHQVSFWVLPSAAQRGEWERIATVRISIPDHVRAKITKADRPEE